MVRPVCGVHMKQIVRANRTHPELADGSNATYRHAPDITFFHGRFYVQYICSPVDEHEPGGFCMLASFASDFSDVRYEVAFPTYRIPKCTVTDYKGMTHEFDGDSYVFPHQRMSFFRSSEGRLLLLAFYGWSPEKWMTNWDNYGIGRVVREVYSDGSLGDIFFIFPNYQAGWTDELLNYPLYTASQDAGFVKACEELLNDRLYTQQWAEENGDKSELITVKHPEKGTYQAFNWYHIDSDTVVGLWKHSFAAVSLNNGETWSKVKKAPSLVMSGQKIWGEKTSDGRFALVYDPTLESQHRYPLCLITGEDGVHFKDMRLIHDEVPEKRYAGFWKDYGPQYMRGICEGLTTEDDDPGKDMFITYSVNKEDIWVAKVTVPIVDETEHVSLDVNDLSRWNIYEPSWSSVKPCREANGDRTGNGECLEITDAEPVTRAVVRRALKQEKKKAFEIELIPQPAENKPIVIQLTDAKNIPAVRVIFKNDGFIYVRTTTDVRLCEYDRENRNNVKLEADCETFSFKITINGKEWEHRFYSAVNDITVIELATALPGTSPTLTDDPETKPDLPEETEEKAGECRLYLYKVEEIQNEKNRKRT